MVLLGRIFGVGSVIHGQGKRDENTLTYYIYIYIYRRKLGKLYVFHCFSALDAKTFGKFKVLGSPTDQLAGYLPGQLQVYHRIQKKKKKKSKIQEN